MVRQDITSIRSGFLTLNTKNKAHTDTTTHTRAIRHCTLKTKERPPAPFPQHLPTHHWRRQSCLLHRDSLIRWIVGEWRCGGWQAKTGKLPLHEGWYRSLTLSSYQWHFIHTWLTPLHGWWYNPSFRDLDSTMALFKGRGMKSKKENGCVLHWVHGKNDSGEEESKKGIVH